MMKLFKLFVTAFLFCALPLVLSAQEKTQAYYNSHENEILPDARASFRRGDYDRTIELCKWHYIIVGDHAADQLRANAERCSKLSKDMVAYQADGKIKDAKEIAEIILSLNPEDRAAKAVSEIVETPVPEEVPIEVQADTAAVTEIEIPIQEELPVEETEPKEIPVEEPQLITLEQQVHEPSKPVKHEEPRTRFVIKAGATVLDLKQFSKTISPGGSLGVYDIGGSRIGLEVGGYFCPGLSASSTSLFGIDASLVVRLSNSVYPKAEIGFFSCSTTNGSGSRTKGLCGGLGLNFLLGGHFCLEIGAKYYPVVKVRGTESYSTAGVTYEFPTAREVLPGGVAPMVSIGYAF